MVPSIFSLQRAELPDEKELSIFDRGGGARRYSRGNQVSVEMSEPFFGVPGIALEGDENARSRTSVKADYSNS